MSAGQLEARAGQRDPQEAIEYAIEVEQNKIELANVLAIDLHSHAARKASARPATARTAAKNVQAVYEYADAHFPATTHERSTTAEFDHLTSHHREGTALPAQMATVRFSIDAPLTMRRSGTAALRDAPQEDSSDDDNPPPADYLLPNTGMPVLSAKATAALGSTPAAAAAPLADTVAVDAKLHKGCAQHHLFMPSTPSSTAMPSVAHVSLELTGKLAPV